MDLVSGDQFAQSLAALPPAPNHAPVTFGDDVTSFAHGVAATDFSNSGRAFSAGAQRTIENDLPVGMSDDWVMGQQYEPIVEALNKAQGRHPSGLFSDGNMIGNPFQESGQRMPPDYYDGNGMPLVPRQSAVDFIWAQVAKERARNPGAFGQLPQNAQEVLENTRAEQRASIAWSNSLAQSGGFLGGTVPTFAGQAVGGFADPFNDAAMLAGFPASESLLKTALIEGAGNAAVDLAGLPFRAQHYSDIGEPMSAGDMVGEVAASATLGAGFGVGGKLVGRMLGLGGHDLVREFEDANPDPSPTLRTAAAMVEDRANLDATNPFADTPEGIDLHRQAVQSAQIALDDRNPQAVPDFADQVEAQARSDAPEAFAPFDQALAERDDLRQQLSDLGAARAQAPDVAAAQGRIDDILGKVNGIESRLTNAASDRLRQARADLDAAQTGDTPAMADLRQQVLAADFRARDAGPAVAKAFQEARVKIGPDEAAAAQAQLRRGPAQPAPGEALADAGQHVPRHDPESLKRFSDPIRKPEAFREQADDLAREISPPPEAPTSEGKPGTPRESAAGKGGKADAGGGADENATSGRSGVSGEPSPFGEAVAQVEALRRLDGEARFPDPVTGQENTVKAARTEIERHARAVERLRGCITGEG